MILKIFIILGVLLAILLAALTQFVLNYKVETPVMTDGWWGSGPRQEDTDTSIRKFKISVPDKDLTDLKFRLKNTRYKTDLEEGTFEYGFQTTYMKEVVKYWQEKFDWRKQEAALNKYDHFKTKIEGIDIHFMHVKPAKSNLQKVALPLLMVHGWPGSVWEFHKVLPLLTDASLDVVFEVICPSIPGYGYSEAPKKKGFGQQDAARVFTKLMKRLGFEKFYVQGGDWGSLIVSILSAAYPQNVLGMHLNMFAPPPLPKSYMKQAIGTVIPSLLFEEGEAEMMLSIGPKFLHILEETGYMHIQATKPDTVAMGLTDSPVGLAAYILEKFGTWTNKTYRNLPDGGITKKFTLDDLLTNIMIYWTNGNIVSSVRFYKEYFNSGTMDWDGVEVTVPAGLALFPEEIVLCPRTLAADKYTNIVQFTTMPRGGHFAAFEEPHLFESDLRSFVRTVEATRKDKNK